MTDPNTHINYSIEDIERYINGGMSAKEMHDMEKAALQDPFLADAIEGYSEASMQQSHQHLNEITALLQKDNATAKVVTMPVRNFQWLRIAAMVIVIAGIGAFSLYLIDNNKQPVNNEIAAVKESKDHAASTDTATITIETDAGKLTSKADTTTYTAQKRIAKHKQQIPENELKLSDNTIAASRLPQTTLSSHLTLSEDSDKYNKVIANQDDSVSFLSGFASGVEIQKRDTNIKKATIVLRGTSNNVKLNNFSGYIKDNNNQPVPDALINAGRQAVLADKNGYFNLQSPDSTLQVAVSSIGFETANTGLKEGNTNNIVIAPDAQSLSEVVVTGYTSQRKEETKNTHTDSTFPAGGWESFQQYVYRKMNMPFDSANVNYSTTHGDVEIEFSVNENGDPYNFKVVRSLGKEKDDKAIDAIKNGPRWITSKKNRKAKVAIRL